MSDYLTDLVRRDDHDRFLTAQFTPADRRGDTLALLAFNCEVARIRESVSEVLIGAMKLQWWRDVVAALYEGRAAAFAGNPVVAALGEAIGRRGLSRVHFDTLLDARAQDLEDAPLHDVAALEVYAEGTASRLTWLMLEALGVRDEPSVAAARHVGIAWALTGIARAVLFQMRANHVLLPTALMEQAGLSAHDVTAANRERLAGVVAEMARIAEAHIAKARGHRVDPKAVPALLPATLAERYLKALARLRYDVFDPRHGLQRPAVARLTWNALRGRF